MIEAREARKIATQIKEKSNSDILDKIHENIKISSSKGLFSTTCHLNLSKEVIDHLKNNGYNVKIQNDPRDSFDINLISW